ncbi:MAG: FAD-binding oxidoreductase, partial [Candidatus Dormibacteraeota bacterium]|nr:FAD-binding oxidoreductase [Candidatus Dormibacteraeota bacterium]
MSTCVTPTDVDQLARLVAGPVFRPDHPQLSMEMVGYLPTDPRPSVAVGATCTRDVAAAVRFAAEWGLPVAVHATGHGGAAPIEGGVLITTRRMAGFEIDAERRVARISAGTRMRQVIQDAGRHGLAALVGSNPSVGAIGYTTGGGVPLVGRQFGFAGDHVQALELVTADGQVRHVSPTRDADLFWAVRGGGGSFGVVTSVTLSLLEVPTLYAGSIFFAGERTADVLHAYRAWAPTLPEQVTTSVALCRLPVMDHVPAPLASRQTVAVRFVGNVDARTGDALLRPLRGVSRPLLDTVRIMPYAGCGSVHMEPADPLPFWSCAAGLSELPGAAVDELVKLAGPGVNSPFLLLEVRQLGGALARSPEFPNAVGGRAAAYAVMAVGVAVPGLVDDLREAGGNLLAALA